MPVYIFLKMCKWQYITTKVGYKTHFLHIFRSYLAGMSLGFITPGRIGEIGRAFFVEGGSRAPLAVMVIYDRLFEVLAVILLSFYGLFLLFGLNVIVPTCMGYLVILYLAMRPRVVTRLMERIPVGMDLVFKWKRLVEGMELLNLRHTGIFFGMNILVFLLGFFQLYLLLFSFGYGGGTKVTPFFPIILLANVFPITISGIGIREMASAVILSRHGVAKEIAINASLFWFLIDVALPALLGMYFIFQYKICRR